MRLATFLLCFAVLCGCAGRLQPMRVADPKVVYGQVPDWGIACQLLRASRCAYAIDGHGELDPSDPSYRSCSTTWTARRAISDDGLRLNAVLAAVTPDSVIVAYRGTLGFAPGADRKRVLKDWVQDADYEAVNEQNVQGKVHRGFLKAVTATWSDLLGTLQQWYREGLLEGRKLYVTGHSKGGAAAPIAGVKLRAAGFTPAAVYTFAAARPGDAEFSKSAASGFQVWRYENRYDIVPHLPPNSADGPLIEALLDDEKVRTREEYESVGHLMYVNWMGHLTAVYEDLVKERLDRFRARLREPGVAQAVVNAHSSAERAQYDESICQNQQPEAP
jgi:hypothetical protein